MSMNTSLTTDWDEYVSLRRDIHRHPELGFEEHRTAGLVADRLKALGYTVTEGIAGTGLVGTLRHGTSTRSIGLRADMDALPIQEANDIAWASATPNTMHACGHDGHTAILLAAAETIARRKAFDGTVHLIFQPAEELGGGGGARRMLEDGLFERFPCDAVFALHNMPGRPVGQFMFKDGVMMASADRVVVTFRGKGGHGAVPQQAIDPTIAAASAIMALQTIVSRNIDPLQSTVISVGKLNAGSTYNVIPNSAQLELSVRTFSASVRDQLETLITRICTLQAASFGATADVDYQRGYPVLVNTTAETESAVAVARRLFGDDRVVPDIAPLMGSEDFAYMLQACPGSYLLVGNGEIGVHNAATGLTHCMVHNPGYDFNDDCLAPAATFWAALVEHRLSPASAP
ncbi:amidohydrolase [Parapusillimonas sp. SGNA-6]|nr:amidohydrolase [Parapusillimonas sp. SGNA-6]